MKTATVQSPARAAEGRIREIDPSNRKDLATIGRLHVELLDFGPMSALGERFIRDVCYRIQMVDGLLHVALYEVDGVPAGFVAYTGQSTTFHRTALKNHVFYVLWVLGVSLLENPLRLSGLPRVLRVVRSRRGEAALADGPLGELVCLVARPEYLEPGFVRRSGLRVSQELVHHAMKRLRQQGHSRMRLIVDADNTRTLFLYHRLGARFEPYSLGGKPSLQVWFDLEPPKEQ